VRGFARKMDRYSYYAVSAMVFGYAGCIAQGVVLCTALKYRYITYCWYHTVPVLHAVPDSAVISEGTNILCNILCIYFSHLLLGYSLGLSTPQT